MIATIINFSTNELGFLSHCLRETQKFSQQTIVSVCDHFFDGTPEDLKLLESIYSAHEDVEFLQFAWNERGHFGQCESHIWHNLARFLGFYHVKPETPYVLFLDVDEIPDGNRFCNWLKTFSLEEYSALRLACYWYFRESYYQATEWEDTPLLVSKAHVHYDLLMHAEERAGMYWEVRGNKKRFIIHENQPFIHHYSWVRSKEEMLRKTRTWGHRHAKNWEHLIEKEFSAPFSGTDFVNNYQFVEVEPFVKLNNKNYVLQRGSKKNVRKLSSADISKIDLKVKFGI